MAESSFEPSLSQGGATQLWSRQIRWHSFVRGLVCIAALLLYIRMRRPRLVSMGEEMWCPMAVDTTVPDLYEASIVELQSAMNNGLFSSVDLVKAYRARIEEVNIKGPALHAVIEVNPSALLQAQVLDEERALLGPRGPLHGIPLLVKDNIGTISSEGMNTTAGSYALLGSVVPRDAGVVTRLRAAGAIILGKANIDEFSGSRGHVGSGWSGRGGQATNAFFFRGDPDGSSCGSGVAASIGLAAATVGTDTDGSITGPASKNNIVGVKPTLGLTSRAGVIPISLHQDSVGPMGRSVSDVAAILSIMAGVDSRDNYTSAIPQPIPDYTKALRPDALKGKRIGVPRKFTRPEYSSIAQVELAAFEKALGIMESLGATVVDHADLPSAEAYLNITNPVARVDFKRELNAWLAGLVSSPTGVRNLADLVAFNDGHKGLEEPAGHEDQTSLRRALSISEEYDSEYFEALAREHDISRTRGIDAALKTHRLDALVLPAQAMTTTPSSKAGYPVVTVPLGFFPNDTVPVWNGPETMWPVPGGPFGLSFIGTAWTEFDLIGFAYAYEQKTRTRLQRKAYAEAVPKTQLVNTMGKQTANAMCTTHVPVD